MRFWVLVQFLRSPAGAPEGGADGGVLGGGQPGCSPGWSTTVEFAWRQANLTCLETLTKMLSGFQACVGFDKRCIHAIMVQYHTDKTMTSFSFLSG